MIETFTRTLNDREQAGLQNAISQAQHDANPFLAFLSLLIASAVLIGCGFATVAAFRLINPFIGPLFAMPLGFGAILGLYSVLQTVEKFREASDHARRTIPVCREALEENQVAVKRVIAERVIVIEASEEEGPGYLFDIGDGQLLVLIGPNSDDVVDAAPWPNTEFEVVRTVRGDLWLGICCSGVELLPLKVVQSSDCDADFVSSTREELVTASLEDYADSLLLPE